MDINWEVRAGVFSFIIFCLQISLCSPHLQRIIDFLCCFQRTRKLSLKAEMNVSFEITNNLGNRRGLLLKSIPFCSLYLQKRCSLAFHLIKKNQKGAFSYPSPLSDASFPFMLPGVAVTVTSPKNPANDLAFVHKRPISASRNLTFVRRRRCFHLQEMNRSRSFWFCCVIRRRAEASLTVPCTAHGPTCHLDPAEAVI